MRRHLPIAGLLVVASCGGDDSSVTPTPSPTPSIATLNVTLTPSSQTASATEDASATTLAFTASQSGSTSDPVYPDLQYDKSLLTLQGSVGASGSTYSATFKTADNLGGGPRTGTVTFRLCRDQACATVYPGSTQTFKYTLNISLKDWTAFQRNPAHTGYVHATLDATKFAQAWQWSPSYTTDISTAANLGSSLYVSISSTDTTSSVVALSADAGKELWRAGLGQLHSMSAPSLSNNKVFVSTMISSSDNNKNYVLDAGDGHVLTTLDFAAQWSSFISPTPYDTDLYMSAGYYGGKIYDYDLAKNASRWIGTSSGYYIWDNETPAVDDKYVYFYSSAGLDLFDRKSGALVKTIADTGFQWGGYSYHGAPVLGNHGDVVAYSGSYTGATTSPKPLVSYSLSSDGTTWRSSAVYSTVPAVANDAVYISRNDPEALAALDEVTGALRWSWTPPAGERLVGNTIATDNIVFVSTDKSVYAISLGSTTPTVLWSAATPGDLSISSNGMLLVATHASQPQLTAYRLW